MTEHVVPFSDLSQGELDSIERFNWVAVGSDGLITPTWSQVKDERYGTIRHIAVKNDETGATFDKVELDWSPAAFVVIYRRNEDKTEFLLPSEKRILLKDENGEQGKVYIRNIPQGLVKNWQDETPEEAALREVKEETGLEPISITRIQDIYFDAANSSTAMPFFLAEVENRKHGYNQYLDDSEDIRVGEGDWFSIEDIPGLRLQCAKTLSGIMLATGYLGLWQESDK